LVNRLLGPVAQLIATFGSNLLKPSALRVHRHPLFQTSACCRVLLSNFLRSETNGLARHSPIKFDGRLANELLGARPMLITASASHPGGTGNAQGC
jgi:hypothetical protein